LEPPYARETHLVCPPAQYSFLDRVPHRDLPPYSPDLNPIEKAWSKLKQLLRSTKARSKEALDQAVTELLPCITPQDAQAWFRLRFGTL
jgi:hypothetical protein